MAYAQALQFWVEKANLPTEGQPCLLVGSLVEVREKMKYYVSFLDEAIFSGMVLLEEPLTTSRGSHPQGAQPMQTDSPVEEVITKITKELTKKEQPPNQFPGWREVLHPSRQVVATRQIPPMS